MSQTSISRSGQPRAIAGQVADTGQKDDVAAFNMDVVSIPFGTGVISDGSERGVLQPTGATPKLRGIVRWDAEHHTGVNGDLDAVGLKPKASMIARRKGRMWVVVDPLVAVGSFTPWTDRGYCRYTVNGGNNVIGAFTNTNDVGKTQDCTAAVLFVSSVILAADGVTKIAEVEANFT